MESDETCVRSAIEDRLAPGVEQQSRRVNRGSHGTITMASAEVAMKIEEAYTMQTDSSINNHKNINFSKKILRLLHKCAYSRLPSLMDSTSTLSGRHLNPLNRISYVYLRCPALCTVFRLYLMLFCLISVSLPTSAKHYASEMSPRVVETEYGRIRGITMTIELPAYPHLRQVDAYRGLPYASLGGSDLRFMPPSGPLVKYDGIHVAMSFGDVCPQRIPDLEEIERTLPLGRAEHYKRILPMLDSQAEECLNLNIYVPVRADNDTEPMAVVMFIHGESYEFGTGNAYDGSVMAAFGKVIVITVNYRLGALGFLSMGDSNAPGNYALLDLVAALHWVRENIPAFGGNPQEVTLLGQGYGGAMVNLLLVSPVTKGSKLFKRAIIESGSALSTWAISRHPLRYTRELAERVNCSHLWGQSRAVIMCLKEKPYQELINVDIQAPKYFSAFAPVIDSTVLPGDIRNLMRKSSVFGNTAVLLGVMNNEGFLFFNQQQVDNGISHEKLQKILRTYVRNVYQFHRQKIYEILLHEYTDWERPRDPKIIRDNLMTLLGDAQMISPMVELSQFHGAYSSGTYMYAFNYPSRLDAYPRWAGGVHGDDLTYVFGAPLVDGISPFISVYTTKEKVLTEAVLTYWTNFIKTGNPNIPRSQTSGYGVDVENRFENLRWPLFDNANQEYLHIAMRPISRHHYRANDMAFWLDLLPKMHVSDNLPPEFHLLDNYNNMSTFETVGTRELNLEDMIPTTTTSTTQPTTTTTMTTTTIPTTTKRTTTSTTPRPTAPPRPSNRSPRTDHKTAHRSTTPKPSSMLMGPDGTLSLSVTIAVGCSLLFLNILIFAGVYYQKDRMRVEMKLRQRELEEKQKEVLAQESENNYKSSTGPETDTNSSSMTTPPMQACMVRQHLQSPIATLPKHPIPVLPPQAPYHSLTTPRRSPRPIHIGNHTSDGGPSHLLKRSSSMGSMGEMETHGNHRSDMDHHGNPSTVV